MLKQLFCACCSALLLGCNPSGDTEQEGCAGFVLRATGADRSFTPADLVAHAAAMGMTEQETQTLLYLEGVSSTVVLREGQSICIDGKPDASLADR